MAKRLSVVDIDRCVGCQSCMFACARRMGKGGLAESCEREGFDPAKLRIPGRILGTASARGRVDESFLRQVVSAYAERVRDAGR